MARRASTKRIVCMSLIVFKPMELVPMAASWDTMGSTVINCVPNTAR